MSKRIFVLLIIFMSLSLIGIIFVQAYYIEGAVKNERDRFEFNVKRSLSYVANTIEKNELDSYFEEYQKLDNKKKDDPDEVSKLFIYQQNNNTKETFIYKSNVLEENYKLSSSLFDIGLDSIDVKNIIGSSKIEVFKGTNISDNDFSNPSSLFNIVPNKRLFEAQRNYFDESFKAYTKTIPIYKRVSKEQVNELLSKKFKENDIQIPYEFAIYSEDLATKVHSDGFENNSTSTYSIAVFSDENNQSSYELLVNFTDDNKYILSSISGMILLSIIFTFIILFTY